MADAAEKKRSFTVEEKLKVVAACKTQSLRAVARQFSVDRNCVRAWRDQEAELMALHPTARRLPGAGRPPASAAAQTGAKRGVETAGANADEPAQRKKAKADEQTAEQTQDAGAPAPLPANYVLVGFQGKEGAFSEVAAKAAFEELRAANALTPSDFMTVGLSLMTDVVEAVERGALAFGVLPVENSISGTFHGNLDRLVASHLKIVGEVACVQELCLCALPGVELSEIKQLSSHPAVLDHCESYICAMERRLGRIIERNAAWDSAGACQTVKQQEKRHVAAIASEQAAQAHGLVVLECGVGDELNSETRYMILGRLDAPPLPLGAARSTEILSTRSPTTTKSSIVVAVPNEPQALFKIVSAFALRNVMIVKIESRPAATAGSLFTAQTTHWDYIFYIDYVTSQDPTQEARLRANLEEFALWVKDLGTYSSSGGKASVEPPRWKSVVSAIAWDALSSIQRSIRGPIDMQSTPEASCYSVELIKGAYGLGIYFAAAADASHAVVDTRVPFYRLPSGALAPGEASGAVAPGDLLLSVNDSDVSTLRFPQIVEQLRQVPRGPVTMVFQRQAHNQAETSPETQVEAPEENCKKTAQQDAATEEKERPKGWTMFQRLSAGAAAAAASTSTDATALQELEGKLREVEETLAREQKCRFLAERKNVLYRNELLRVSHENAALRDQLGQAKLTQKRRDSFVTESLHLAI
ncbi:prephenate dehydratase [Phytophthora pseudosyringae]|uniref:Prephenate dehydratase n=1 Tax=Phytophthora pseudosyringae TaxID=221518 RepID=A0A8T1WEF2_9STRA|nr:prephenate dehydratase [Phytophthora pseudosyringae]